MDIKKTIKDWMLPVAMVTGAFIYLLYHIMPEPTFVRAARTFNGSHACYFIVHADRTFEVKGYIQVLPTDLLILGIDIVPDFAMNIGKAYAWRKGIISKDVLTEFSLGNHLI